MAADLFALFTFLFYVASYKSQDSFFPFHFNLKKKL